MKKYIILTLTILLISCEGRLPYNLGKGYYLDYDPNGYYTVYLKNEHIIKSDILEMNHNSTFIVAEVKPIDLKFKSFEGKKDLTYDVENEIIKKSKLREYWIVNKEYSKTYGPFNKSEFNKKRKELGIPDPLNLLRIDEFLDQEYDRKK